jgi:hypothetical protein
MVRLKIRKEAFSSALGRADIRCIYGRCKARAQPRNVVIYYLVCHIETNETRLKLREWSESVTKRGWATFGASQGSRLPYPKTQKLKAKGPAKLTVHRSLIQRASNLVQNLELSNPPAHTSATAKSRSNRSVGV